MRKHIILLGWLQGGCLLSCQREDLWWQKYGLWHLGACDPALRSPFKNKPSPSECSEQFIGTSPQNGHDGCRLLQTRGLSCPCLLSGCPVSYLDGILWLFSCLTPSVCCPSYSSSLALHSLSLFASCFLYLETNVQQRTPLPLGPAPHTGSPLGHPLASCQLQKHWRRQISSSSFSVNRASFKLVFQSAGTPYASASYTVRQRTTLDWSSVTTCLSSLSESMIVALIPPPNCENLMW